MNNKSKITVMQKALTTNFVAVDGLTVYTPDGNPEGIVTFEFKKWESHAEVNYFQVSIPFNEARALATQLELALQHIDTQLHIMKERRNG